MRQPAPHWASLQPMAVNPMPAAVVPLFLFLHIPKTAGSSLRFVLSNMFGPYHHFVTKAEEIKPTPENEKAWADPASYNRFLLLGGHVLRGHPMMNPKIARRRIYLSVFRDPVKRAVSGYDFSRRFEGHPMREELADRTLLQAITMPGMFRTRYINDQLRYVFNTTNPNRALAALREGNYILAPMEKLEGFVDAVSAISGLPRPAAIPRRNKADELDNPNIQRAAEQPDYEEALTAIAEANAAEIRFIRTHIRDVVVTHDLRPAP